jgi:hypothetical protein
VTCCPLGHKSKPISLQLRCGRDEELKLSVPPHPTLPDGCSPKNSPKSARFHEMCPHAATIAHTMFCKQTPSTNLSAHTPSSPRDPSHSSRPSPAGAPVHRSLQPQLNVCPYFSRAFSPLQSNVPPAPVKHPPAPVKRPPALLERPPVPLDRPLLP